ncbi:hypothetical protein D3493_05970 [Listeria monocytogenes]|nr:hypothetical protein [Listeria monocytogenes]
MVLKKNIHRKNNFPSEEKGILNAQFPRKLKNLPESIFLNKLKNILWRKKNLLFCIHYKKIANET